MMTKRNEVTLSKVDNGRLMDSLVNLTSGLGVRGKDKRVGSAFVSSGRMSYTELEALYQEDWIAGKIVDIIPNDMVRNWRTFSDASLSPEQRTLVMEEEKRLCVKKHVNECKKWSRLYGGALIVLNIDDGKDASEPVDIDNIPRGSLKNLIVFDRRHANPNKINHYDPFAENFRAPETYRLSGTSGDIHHTRVIRMDGIGLPYHLFTRNEYWGDPILRRIRDALVNANVAVDSSAGLLFESNVDIIGVTNLLPMLATDEGTEALTRRFAAAKYLKSNNSMTLYDKEKEEVNKLTNSLAGIGDLLDRFMTILSATSDTPATRLFGKSPVGMNATGDSDLQNYYDNINSLQELELRPDLEYIDRAIAASNGIDPKKMQFEFEPLWQLADDERAVVLETSARAFQTFFDMGVLTESMIAREAKNQKLLTTITDEHIELLAAAERELEEELRNEPEGEEGDPEEGEADPEEADPEEADPEEAEGAPSAAQAKEAAREQRRLARKQRREA